MNIENILNNPDFKNEFFKSIIKEYNFFVSIKDLDLEMGLVRARRIVERIARKLFIDNIGPCDKINLHEVIESLKREKIINAIIYAKLIFIKELGNYGAHFLDSNDVNTIDVVLKEDVEICHQSLQLIIKYYYEIINNSQDDLLNNDIKLEVIYGRNLNIERLSEVFELARSVYDKNIVIPLDILKIWFKRNPDIFICVEDTQSKRIVGYISALPLTNDEFKNTLKDDFDETKICIDNILTYKMPDFIKLYLCSIVVDPVYQKATLVYKKLFDGAIEFLLKLAERDIFIVELSADAVSKDGERICESISMKKVLVTNHNSSIYHVNMLPPTFRTPSSNGVKLTRFYKKKYDEYKDILDLL